MSATNERNSATNADWVSLTEAAAELGLNRSSVSRAAARHEWPQRRDGKRILVPRQTVAEYGSKRRGPRAQPTPAPTPSQPAPPPAQQAELSLAAFARRAGVSIRAAQKWRSEGLIASYSEAELGRVLEDQQERAPEASDESDDADADDDALRPDMSLRDLKRRKEYWMTRKLKVQAMTAEGAAYDAAEAEAMARRAGQLIAARVQQVPQTLADQLADKPADEVRRILARWAHRFLAELDAALCFDGDPERA